MCFVGDGWTDSRSRGLIKCSGWCWPWFHLMNSYLPALCFLQELAAEKAKAAAGEAKVKKQLVAREQEITAVQARMQASDREHVQEVQQLQGKVGTVTGRVLPAWFVGGWGRGKGLFSLAGETCMRLKSTF